MTRTLATVAAALLVVLAGCSAAPGTGGGTAPTDGPTSTDGSPATTQPALASGGTVNFYISDEQNAIDQFAHLNVTVTKIGFKRTDGGDDDDANETTTVVTTTATDTTSAATTTATDATTNDTTAGATSTAEATTASTGTATPTPEPESEGDEAGGDEKRSDEQEQEQEQERDEEAKSWTTYDVDNVTVDLTELRGENATLVGQFDLPNGSYTTVFVYVSEVEGTLANGESVNVKLPSQKLQLHERFTVGGGESVDFVFDITVHEAGKSGKYILTPVVSQSGTDVPIERVGDDEERGEERGRSDEARDEHGSETEAEERDAGERTERAALRASLQGPVEPGRNVTLAVRADGPVANATVTVNGQRVGTTGADGTLTFTVPDAEELAVAVTAGEREVELERALSERETGDGTGESDDRG